MYTYTIASVLLVPAFLTTGAFGQRSKDVQKPETQYASSLFRMNRVLEGIPFLHSVANVTSVSQCLMHCMKRKPDCKSFNWGRNGDCDLMADSVCFNETLLLTPREGYAYYDIMDGPDYEKKHLKDGYCRLFGKCSGKCYPRTPHFVDTPMKKSEAKAHCDGLGRTLAMPLNLEEQRFIEAFARKKLEDPEVRTGKNMQFWIGISDEQMEEHWMYDDESPVSDKFSAWATGQPDNGGPYGSSAENCGAIGEKAEMKWTDVNCNLKLKFFCA